MPEFVSTAAAGPPADVLARVDRMALGPWIGGEVRRTGAGSTFVVTDPSTERPIAELPDGGDETIEAAVRAATEAGRTWGRASGRHRAEVLERIADRLAGAVPWLAELETLSTGRPIREMRAQLAILPEWYRYFAAVARTAEGSIPPFGGRYLNIVRRRPLGVIAQITPWNHPLLILTKKVAPAIAAGNTVVVKPSELAPISALAFAGITAEAGLPPGVLNVVPGLGRTTGAALAGAGGLAKIDVTGGTETGRGIAAAAGGALARFSGELGGKAPVLLFDDIPIDVAARAAAFAGFIASGQTCVQGARVLVARSIADRVGDELATLAQRIRVGDPFDPATQMGPLVSAQQRDRVDRYVAAARDDGIAILAGGHRGAREPGFFYLPTVLAEVDPASPVAQEEIFGPVSCLIPFDDEADAIRLGNGTAMGLAASIWTRDLGRAHRVAEALDCGIVWVNDHHRVDPASPWGGFKASGIGRENGLEAWREYTQTQSVIVALDNPDPDWYDTADERRLN
jgi:acyl-CoA reductase-like NAD-dependent aldehyde dehydrogenase